MEEKILNMFLTLFVNIYNFYTKGFRFKTMHVYCNSVIQLIRILYEGAETPKRNYFEIGGWGGGSPPFFMLTLIKTPEMTT